MPAQRRTSKKLTRVSKGLRWSPKGRRTAPKIKKRRLFFPIKALTLLVFLAVSFTFIRLSTYFWDGASKLSIAIARENGDVEIAVLDPKSGSLTIVVVPKDTEVEVARHLGIWRMKNVRKLGEKEDIGGELVAETVTKHFKFPVYVWADEEALGLVSGDFKSVFKPYKTNLGLGDRLRVFYFALSIKNTNKEVINLSETKFLKEATLKDGEVGYQLSGSVFPRVLSLFSDPSIVTNQGRAKIIDRTGENIGREVGQIIETLGLKVSSISDEEVESSECEVFGENRYAVNFFARVFDCIEGNDIASEYDLILSLGKSFEKRF